MDKMPEFDQPIAMTVETFSRATIRETRTFVIPRSMRNAAPNQIDDNGKMERREEILDWLIENATEVHNKTETYDTQEQISMNLQFMYCKEGSALLYF